MKKHNNRFSRIGQSSGGHNGRPQSRGHHHPGDGQRPPPRFQGGNPGRGGKTGRRVAGTNINIHQLINKVNDDALVKPVEHEIKHQFSDFLIDQRLKENIKQKGYINPTPIQDQSIPVGLQGRDVIGIANTGTGKTAAFLIPLINKMLFDRSQKALILTPTRELAQQIFDELRIFSRGFNLGAVLCIGGTSMMQQVRMIKSPFNFIIGTPGRIIDLYDRRLLHLDRFQNVVLDEADRMVDMGFINDMRLILGKLMKNRQSFFFTATLEPKVEELIRQFMNSPVKVSVKMRDTAVNVDQDVIHVPKDMRSKITVLVDLLSKPGFEKVLVFGRTKFGVEKIAKMLKFAGVHVESIHGDKTQSNRKKSLMRFKQGDVQVLVATDVAARGLDIHAVSHVINFDPPMNYDDYVHRIGRTGRADMKGIALTFVTEK